MVRDGGMSDVGARHAGHVTFDAIVLRTFLAADVEVQPTALFVMAGQAAAAVEIELNIGRRIVMRIVTSKTAELPAAFLETATGVHLLDVTDRASRILLVGRQHKEGHDFAQRQSRPIVVPTTMVL